MIHRLKVVLSLSLVVILLPLVPSNTLAQVDHIEQLFWQITEIAETQGTAEAYDFFYALTEEEQAALTSAILDVTPTVENSFVEEISPESMGLSSNIPNAGGCWGWQTDRLYENVFGADMFRYYHRTEWCGNGSQLTSATSYAWPEIYSIWWDFSNHLSNGAIVSGGVGYYSAGTFSQGRFVGVFGETVGQVRTPWMRHDIDTNGGYALSGGG